MRRFEILPRGGGWKWRLIADNGRVLAESFRSYRNHLDCRASVDFVLSLDVSTPVLDTNPASENRGAREEAIVISRR